MELCSDGHDEICHESRKCPICELIDETKKEHESEVETLEARINELLDKLGLGEDGT